jgi:hypothetical protein
MITKEVIDMLIKFQLFLAEQNLISTHDWDFENKAIVFVKKNIKKPKA